MLSAEAIEQPDTPYQARVFASDQAERDRILGALWATSSIRAFAIAERITKCCREPMIFTNDASDQVRLSERRCRSRLCTRCRYFRRGELQARLLEACKRMDTKRFIGLTLESSDRPLRDQLIDLRQSFARLRRSTLWRERATGGVYCIEVTYNRERRQWHPHLHAIVDGRYIHKPRLSEAWYEASNGSYIVDISAIASAGQVVKYITKYVAKSDDASSFPDPQIAEWASEVHGLRLVHTFGHLHGVQLLQKPEKQPSVSRILVNPTLLADQAFRGDRVAASLLDELDRLASGATDVDQVMLVSRLRTWSTLYFDALRHKAITDAWSPPPRSPSLFT